MRFIEHLFVPDGLLLKLRSRSSYQIGCVNVIVYVSQKFVKQKQFFCLGPHEKSSSKKKETLTFCAQLVKRDHHALLIFTCTNVFGNKRKKR